VVSPKSKPHPEPPEYPLTLRNLRLALVGRFGRPMTQVQAAKKIKVSQSHLANVEQGKMPASQFLLWRVAEAYEIDLQLVRQAYRGSRARLDRPENIDKPKSNTRKTPKKPARTK